jgi:hypothetical protein
MFVLLDLFLAPLLVGRRLFVRGKGEAGGGSGAAEAGRDSRGRRGCGWGGSCRDLLLWLAAPVVLFTFRR